MSFCLLHISFGNLSSSEKDPLDHINLFKYLFHFFLLEGCDWRQNGVLLRRGARLLLTSLPPARSAGAAFLVSVFSSCSAFLSGFSLLSSFLSCPASVHLSLLPLSSSVLNMIQKQTHKNNQHRVRLLSKWHRYAGYLDPCSCDPKAGGRLTGVSEGRARNTFGGGLVGARAFLKKDKLWASLLELWFVIKRVFFPHSCSLS